ncbi:ankyrin repeat-containing domain protein, partial [Podospora fimiseda]
METQWSWLVELLLVKGANPSLVDHRGWTALMVECWHWNTDTIKLLLRASGVDTESVNLKAQTALSWAIEGQPTFRAVRILIEEEGADLSHRDQLGRTILDLA